MKKTKNKKRNFASTLLLSVLALSAVPQSVLAAEPVVFEQAIQFNEGFDRSASQTITLPVGAAYQGATVNTGTVVGKQTGRSLKVDVSGGTAVGNAYNPYRDSMSASGSRSSSYNSFPATIPYSSGSYSGTLYKDGYSYVSSGTYIPYDTMWVTAQTNNYYNSGGYSGWLDQYVYSGAYTPADSNYISNQLGKTQTGSCNSSMGTNWYNCNPAPPHPATISYSSGGYTGTLSYSDYDYYQTPNRPWGGGHVGFDYTRKWFYSGTVYKPASDTRTYRYQGTVSRPESDTRRYTQRYSGTAYSGGDAPTYAYTVNVKYVIDTEAPYGTITQTPTGWTNGDVTIQVRDIQDSGGSWYSSTVLPNGTVTTNPEIDYTVPGNGSYDFTFRDEAGNSRTQTHVVTNIDKSGPSADVIQTPSTWTNGNVMLNLESANDALSGLKHIKRPDGVIVTGKTNTSYEVTVNGTYTFELEDNVGNKTVKTINVTNIDRIAPTGNLTASPTSATVSTVTLTVSSLADSGGSGIKEVERPDGSISTGSGNVTFLPEANGTYSFIIRDHAGNETTKTITVSNIDREPPVGTLSYTPEDWTNKSVLIRLSDIKDIGIAGYSYVRLPSGSTTSSTNVTYTVQKNGDYTFVLADRAGNLREVVAEVRQIDKSAPLIMINEKIKADEYIQMTINIQDRGDSK